jgi:type I restriction enzyme, S subunit
MNSLPPGYKQTEVGVIPEDWEVSPLEEFTSFISYGFTNPMPTSESGVYMITAKDINQGRIQFDTARCTTEEAYRTLLTAKSRPKNGDLLLTKDGTLGRVALVDQRAVCINQSVAILRPNSKAVPQFLKVLLEAPAYQNRMLEDAGGSTIKHIYITIVNRMPLALPPTKAEQCAIAEALTDADALIESLEQLLAKKRQIKQGAMQELLTGKKRLPGFEVKPGYKQTEVGVIPEDWDVAKLAAVCSMKSGEGITSASIDQFSEYPCYGGNGLRGFTTRFTHNGRYALIGRQGALCGNVLGVEGELFASEHAIVVTACARTDIRWLTFVLGEMRLNQYSESSAQPGLSVAKLLSLDVAHPPTKAEQTAIATILSDMDAEIAALEAKLAKARNIKQGMMQELLTGRIRLV